LKECEAVYLLFAGSWSDRTGRCKGKIVAGVAISYRIFATEIMEGTERKRIYARSRKPQL
jgi:hypothetical protein